MMKKELPLFLYGGDYNPEQWPEETWVEDIKVFKQADINSATINVFSWALLEPQEGKYDFISCVNFDGYIERAAQGVEETDSCIRPAFWLRTD